MRAAYAVDSLEFLSLYYLLIGAIGAYCLLLIMLTTYNILLHNMGTVQSNITKIFYSGINGVFYTPHRYPIHE